MKPTLELFLISKVISIEARAVFYGENTFKFVFQQTLAFYQKFMLDTCGQKHNIWIHNEDLARAVSAIYDENVVDVLTLLIDTKGKDARNRIMVQGLNLPVFLRQTGPTMRP